MADQPSYTRYAVVVSRLWHEPKIRVSVDDAGIAASMILVDFVEALFRELSLPESEQARVIAAVDRIVAEMKDSTGRAM